ncbi:MAG TPA: proprotein convertase P-domain-containing protein, partial [Candidatus Paceibacterota bacterium]|nr:proprotein convertase P-domain-containing protein [Candidatus Paceibacterota bacterium]
DVSGQILMNQHVGANPPLLSSGSVGLNTNTTWGAAGANGVISLGVSNQWHFYVITNTTTFSNAVFAVFLPPTLSIPRMGVTNYKRGEEATRVEADIDLYVSTDRSLLALDPGAIASADKSLGRKGTEFIVYTNSVQNRVYYVGVHCEDQQASEYAFLGMFSLLPFDDGNGNMHWFPLPAMIPDGTPDKPGGVTVFGINTRAFDIRRVVATNNLTHERMDDLFGQLQHNSVKVVLNNHSCVPDTSASSCRTNVNYIYEDNGENDIPGSQPTDGPGKLTDFIGESAQGIWMLTEVDNAFGSTGVVNRVSLRLEEQPDLRNGMQLNIEGHSFRFAFVDVPPEGTNLTICVLSNSQPLQLYVRRGDLPSLTVYDYTLAIPAGVSNSAHCLTIDKLSDPPLRTGRYYIGVYNPNAGTVSAWLTATVLVDTNPIPTVDFSMFGPQSIPDDAVSYSSINVPYDRQVARVDVDVAIQHPRISDMALSLLSPSGKRILLFENRGGSSSDLGSVTVTTNYIPPINQDQFGTTNLASTNSIPITNSTGVLVIDFDFLVAPDTLDVYYGTTNIYSTGLISGKGNFSIPFGPGSATNLTIIVNKDNNPNNPGTAWQYSAQVITVQGSYFTFSENTNLTKLPIKFAPTPFIGRVVSAPVMKDGFENGVPSGTPVPAGTNVSGWHVDSGDVDVLYPGFGFFGLPAEGSQALDLNGSTAGVISTNFILIPGTRYQLTFAYTKNPGGPGGYTASMDVALTGQPTLQFDYSSTNTYSTLNWSNASISFTATDPTNTLQVSSLVPSGNAGMYLDDFAVTPEPTTNSTVYFPEESLKDLQGENAKGEWKLELWDNRVGATNPAPQLLSWRLRFLFDEPVSSTIRLHHDVPVTNTLAPCQMAYFSVDVPSWAKFITNTLVSSTAPVNVYWNTNTLPAAGGTNVGDFPLLVAQPTTTGVGVLDAAAVGSKYFIAVENPCSSTTNATFVFKIEFDTTALSNNIPVTSTNLGNNVPRYFYYDVSTNATAVSFSLTNMSGNFDMVVHRGGPLPPEVPYDYGSFNPGTLDEQIIVFTNSTPVPLTPGRWYIGVYNTSLASNVFTIVVSEYTNSFVGLITLTNGIPYTNSAPSDAQQSYRYDISSGALRAQFEINSPSGDMVLVARKGLPLPDLTSYDYLSDNPFLNDELIVLLPGSTPVPLTPGSWFLTAVNVSGGPVNYSIKATEWQSTGQPITVTHVGYTPPGGTNVAELCITWASLPGVHYYLQSIADLTTTNWAAASPTITAVDYTTTYCVPIGPGNEFFRVVEGLALSSFAPPQNFKILPVAGGFLLQWRGSDLAQYQAQWTTNLVPAFWTAFTPTNMTPANTPFTNGIYSFFDDGSQLGGPPGPSQVFYRILLLP